MTKNPIPPPPPELVSFARRLVDELAYAKENRHEERHHFAVTVEVQPLDVDMQPCGEPSVAVTRDLSTSGIGLLHSRHIDAQYILVTFNTREGPKRLNVEVMRCRAMGRFYDIGGRFVSH